MCYWGIQMEFKEKRVEYINNWPTKYSFKKEEEYKERYISCTNKYSAYSNFIVDNDKSYNIVISNVMDSLDQLPERPDLAFEFYWKAIDNLFKKFPDNNRTSKEQLQYAIKNIWINKINQNYNLKKLIKNLIGEIKEPSITYLRKRMIYKFDINKSLDDQIKPTRQLIKRLCDYFKGRKSEENKIKIIIKNIYNKCNDSQKTSAYHDADRFFLKLITGENLITNNGNIQLSLEEQINFIINGLLYTFRNDRFHGNLISPFRSSYTKFSTYAHPFYCLIWAELLLLLLLEDDNFVDMSLLINHCNDNLKFFKELFSSVN